MEAFETFEHAGFTVELHPDWDGPTSPADWDTLGTLHVFPRRNSFTYGGPGEDAPGDVTEAWERERPGLTIRYLRAQGETALLCQFQDYGSSGQRLIALDDDDDAIASGYISTTAARIAELCGEPVRPFDTTYAPPDWVGTAEAWARHALKGELSDWNAYVSGEVVGVVVRDPETGEVVESCWGFYPERDARSADDRAYRDGYEHVRDEGRAMAEAERNHREKRARETAKGWAMAHGIA